MTHDNSPTLPSAGPSTIARSPATPQRTKQRRTKRNAADWQRAKAMKQALSVKMTRSLKTLMLQMMQDKGLLDIDLAIKAGLSRPAVWKFMNTEQSMNLTTFMAVMLAMGERPSTVMRRLEDLMSGGSKQ